MYQTLLKLIVASMFLLLDGALRVAGYRYTGTDGTALEKIHPAVFLLILAAGMTFLLPRKQGNPAPDWLKGAFLGPLAAGVVATLITIGFSRPDTGDSAAIIVTFLMPPLLAYCLQYASQKTFGFIAVFVPLFFMVNSAIGITENLTGWRLFPYFVGGIDITYDHRPTAMLGHPLPNALLTGMVLIMQIAKMVTQRITPGRLLVAGLYGAALLSFGGRAATAATLLFIVLFLFSRTGVAGRVKQVNFWRAASILMIGALAGPALLSTGLSDRLIERFENADESSETRYVAFMVPEYMSRQEWLVGAEAPKRAMIREVLNTPWGIEVSPVAMMLAYGLPMTIMLILATYYLLYRFASGAIPGATVMALLTITVSWTSLSIGSKTLLISQAMMILLAARLQHEVYIATESRAPNRPRPLVDKWAQPKTANRALRQP